MAAVKIDGYLESESKVGQQYPCYSLMAAMEFSELKQQPDQRTVTFTLSPIHVSYANTLRRLILTGVETVAFRADMTANGTTTDVVVKRNDTPMTNEMLAARIGLLPLNVPEPQKWRENEYQFRLSVAGSADEVRHVTASDFEVVQLTGLATAQVAQVAKPKSSKKPSSSKKPKSGKKKGGADGNESDADAGDDEDDDVVTDSNADDADDGEDQKYAEENVPESQRVDTARFFPPHPLTGQTCLIATLQPGSGPTQQRLELIAKATKGTGREHARFSPVSQCSYEYTLDNDPVRIQDMFEQWLIHAKKVGDIEKGSERYAALDREFRTMQIKRCYKKDEVTGEPYSFDFTIETVGVLSVEYIVERACDVGEAMCARYVNLQTGTLPSEITMTNANCRLVGYDFLFRGHDHTLGNLLQTWLVQNHIEGNAQPKITYAGFSVPHPLRDEMVLRIGVADGEEGTARAAVAAAARGCVGLFQEMRRAWRIALGKSAPPVLGAPRPTGTAPRKIARPRPAKLAAQASSSSSSSLPPTVSVTKLT